MFYTYTYTDPRTGLVFYVGMGTGNRYKVHLQNAKLADGSPKSKFILDIRADGYEPIIKQVFSSTYRQDVLDEEIRLIGLYGKDNLTNRTSGGQGHVGSTSFLGRHHTNDSKEKMRLAKLGKPGMKRTPDAIEKFKNTIARQGHHQKGISRTSDVKEKIRSKLVGQKLTDIQKLQRKESMKLVWDLRKAGLLKMPDHSGRLDKDIKV